MFIMYSEKMLLASYGIGCTVPTVGILHVAM